MSKAWITAITLIRPRRTWPSAQTQCEDGWTIGFSADQSRGGDGSMRGGMEVITSTACRNQIRMRRKGTAALSRRAGLAGETHPGDAELVALRVLHDRPLMAAQAVVANDCRAERDQLVDS